MPWINSILMNLMNCNEVVIVIHSLRHTHVLNRLWAGTKEFQSMCKKTIKIQIFPKSPFLLTAWTPNFTCSKTMGSKLCTTFGWWTLGYCTTSNAGAIFCTFGNNACMCWTNNSCYTSINISFLLLKIIIKKQKQNNKQKCVVRLV